MEMYLWKQESESNKGIYRVNYTIQHFIDKFEAIPEENWTTHVYNYGLACCALGHCGHRAGNSTEESHALGFLFHSHNLSIRGINDGLYPHRIGSSPKERVLTALMSLKNGGS